jgi:hypothetical protein
MGGVLIGIKISSIFHFLPSENEMCLRVDKRNIPFYQWHLNLNCLIISNKKFTINNCINNLKKFYVSYVACFNRNLLKFN